MTESASAGLGTPDAGTDDGRRAIMQWVFGARATETVALAVRLGLPDAIGDGTARAEDLGRRHGFPPRQMTRLLRALASLGLCTEPSPGTFALAPAGALLRKDHPDSLYDFARFHTAPQTLQPWTRLESSLRSGRTAFEEHFGVPLYQYLAGEPELSAVFNAAMSQETHRTAQTLPGAYDFGRFRTVMDVGGGDGTLLAAILGHHPALEGVLFETVEGAAQAADTFKTAGLDGRATVATGDFLASLPQGADLFLIKSVLHNWDDEHATTILRNCRAAMPAHGRVLIVEVVLPEKAAPDDAAELDPYLKDLQMQVLVGGRERTRTDFDQLCAAAGLTVTDVVPLPPHIGFSLVEAAPN
ncbi:methyltransferase [Streptomyces sp. NPDC049555]|uniref:methyltransferase n=1 Tax=Streptomyces sp. NPDC049555 TaxID=3154930 RepID=UPI003432A75A